MDSFTYYGFGQVLDTLVKISGQLETAGSNPVWVTIGVGVVAAAAAIIASVIGVRMASSSARKKEKLENKKRILHDFFSPSSNS